MANGNSGSKTESVSVSLESDLIAALDHVCYLRDMPRSQAVRSAVKSWIASELSRDPSFWERVYHGVKMGSNDKKLF